MQKEEMEIDLALRLKEAGFRLKKGDFDFSIDDRLGMFFFPVSI